MLKPIGWSNDWFAFLNFSRNGRTKLLAPSLSVDGRIAMNSSPPVRQQMS